MDVSSSSRLPWLVVLAAVLVGALLLAAGPGPAIGASVLVAIALGLAVALGPSARGPGMVSGQWMRRVPAPDHELIARHGRQWVVLSGIEQSSLRRVIAAGAATEGQGVRLELIAVALRDDGGIAILVAHARPPTSLGHFLDVAVADDLGTAYTAGAQGQGGPSPGVARIDFRFAPAPPPGAHELTLRIDAFLDPFPGPARRLAGPWSLTVDLAPSA